MKTPHPVMAKLPLLAAILFAFPATANAEFFIDSLSILDNPNDAVATSIGSNGISVEVTGPDVALDPTNSRYAFTAANIGDVFRVRYDWAGVFDDLQSISGLQLETLPVGSFFGNWSLTIDTGVGLPTGYGPTIPTILPSPISLDNATELTFEFRYDGGSPFPSGGLGIWGGPNNPLFATPEPTALIMLGSIGMVGLMIRRRKR